MALGKLVTQGELANTIRGLDALANNLNEHVNQSLSQAHGWNTANGAYLDSGGIYQTDFGQSGFVPIPGIANTGANNDGTLASPGSVDSHWTLVLSADPSFPGPNAFIASPPSGAWSSNGPKSQWISPSANGTQNRKPGAYKYRLTFNLSGLNPASALVKGSWVSDNKTTTVLLNGITTGFTNPSNFSKQPSAGTPFQFTTGFVPGVNTLDFIVNNAASSPTGIRVELIGLASAGGVSLIPTLFNTGVLADNTTQAPQGSVDLHWTLFQSPDPPNHGPNAFVRAVVPQWLPNGTRPSKWIGPRVTGNSANGIYIFRASFDLTGFSPNATIVKGQWFSDQRTIDVRINGISTGLKSGISQGTIPTSFVIASNFLAGINTLDFVVQRPDDGTGNLYPVGFRCEVSGTSATGGSGLQPRVVRLDIDGNVFYTPAQASGGLDGETDPAIPSFTGIVSPQSADPADDLTVGSPASAELVTAFGLTLDPISQAAIDALLQHAGASAQGTHGGLTWQVENVFTTAAYLVGRRTINVLIGGVPYKIVADTNPNGPIF
jgi:hypothetical protein